MSFTGQKAYQSEVALATAYAVAALDRGSEQLQPTIEIIGGTADIFFSQVKPTSGSTGMTKMLSAVVGVQILTVIPNYMYIAQAGGTTTKIITSGVQVKAA